MSQNKKISSHTIDFLYLGIGTLVVVLSTFAIINTPQKPYEIAGAQTTPNSPGGAAIAIPKQSSDTGVVDNLPTPFQTPEKPIVETEEIDIEEEKNTTTPLNPNTKPVNNTISPAENSNTTKASDSNNEAGTIEKTTRTGGETIWIVIAVFLAFGAGYLYYQKSGNRKAKLQVEGKKGKLK
jgi:hypothetical protein